MELDLTIPESHADQRTDPLDGLPTTTRRPSRRPKAHPATNMTASSTSKPKASPTATPSAYPRLQPTASPTAFPTGRSTARVSAGPIIGASASLRPPISVSSSARVRRQEISLSIVKSSSRYRVVDSTFVVPEICRRFQTRRWSEYFSLSAARVTWRFLGCSFTRDQSRSC